WGTQKRAAPELAALTNGVLLRCHDYNDFFVGRRNSGHSSDILSSVIAAAEWTNASGKKLLSAVAIGYELVGAAFDAFSTARGGGEAVRREVRLRAKNEHERRPGSRAARASEPGASAYPGEGRLHEALAGRLRGAERHTGRY